jgi:hypothetical protein
MRLSRHWMQLGPLFAQCGTLLPGKSSLGAAQNREAFRTGAHAT